jgi:pimeloyl-ACP methyl ester carboxylesterase
MMGVMRSFLFFCALSLCVLRAQETPSESFSVPKADAPQLASQGNYAVGVRTIELVHTGQIDILKFDKDTGKAPLYDRSLKVEVWYPATLAARQEQRVIYPSAMPGVAPRTTGLKSFDIIGKAARDAAPVKGQRFPLVVVSHGYPGSRYFLTYLTENLASKGYVVAAIDHTDSVFGEVRGFASTLLNRSNDQLFVLSSIEQLTKSPESFLFGLVQENNAAIVGYSMGGYGALISAGAGLSETSPLNKFVPGGYLADWSRGNEKYQALRRDGLKAIVAIAPWGEQPPYSAWDADSLAAVRLPALFIVGDHDDVAGYADGPKRAMELAVNSDRCLLVYENARHNTGGNPPPPDVPLDYKSLMSFDEPVWRKDRITAINQHFITAFLDLYLKGDQTRRTFLHVPVARSNDGKWPVAPGADDDGAFGSGENFWPGFQRRWALGLQMTCFAPGQQPK